jgi:hypothetical protein
VRFLDKRTNGWPGSILGRPRASQRRIAKLRSLLSFLSSLRLCYTDSTLIRGVRLEPRQRCLLSCIHGFGEVPPLSEHRFLASMVHKTTCIIMETPHGRPSVFCPEKRTRGLLPHEASRSRHGIGPRADALTDWQSLRTAMAAFATD